MWCHPAVFARVILYLPICFSYPLKVCQCLLCTRSSGESLAGLRFVMVLLVSIICCADDSFLFGKAKLDECASIQHILDVFSQASGQEINLGKSSIAFSANVNGREQQGLANFFGVQLVERHKRYLGLPTFAGKNKRQTFAYIKEKVHKRLSGWKGKCLSGAGRELFVKVVAQALPTYAMNYFLLPKTFLMTYISSWLGLVGL